MANFPLQHPLVWIDNDKALELHCAQLQEVSLLALDTEFMRTNTYYPIAGLIQINDGKQNLLIDPLAINDWYPLIELFESDAHTFAMHACSEDLEVLHVETGSVPRRIFDTQVAAAFDGHEPGLGYAKLVNAQMGVELPKSETRSDWLQRPLSQPQLHYAALDVEFLRQLASGLIDSLKNKGRFEWVLEEGVRVYKNFKQHQSVPDSYKKVKSAWKLKPRNLAVLMALSRWRENYAQNKNLPRNRVVKEKALYELAIQCPTTVPQLRRIEGLNERMIRKLGKDLISIVIEQLELDDAQLPKPLAPPLDKENREILKEFKHILSVLAETMNIASEMLMRKKDIETIIRMKLAEDWQAIDAFFSGWRKDIIAKDLISALKKL